jgi:benzoyl-CoA reductase/2-hydroxyglutaryl-CoA dehydratase subunit BcrC/BadD/HgdB
MVKRKKEELLRSMKLGHVPKSAVVGEDLAVAEENADLVAVDVEVAAALKHMNSSIENSENFKLCSFESLLHPVRHVQNLV